MILLFYVDCYDLLLWKILVIVRDFKKNILYYFYGRDWNFCGGGGGGSGFVRLRN